MNDYAALLGTMNRYAEAEAMQREAIAIGRQVLGPGTLTVANLTNNLAVTLTSLGRLADAERAFREAFDAARGASRRESLARAEHRAQHRPHLGPAATA